jgi:hypothetical protein
MTLFDTFLSLLQDAMAPALDLEFTEKFGTLELLTGYNRGLGINTPTGLLNVGTQAPGSFEDMMGEPTAVRLVTPAGDQVVGIAVRYFAGLEYMSVPGGGTAPLATGMAVKMIPENTVWMFVPRTIPMASIVLDADVREKTRTAALPGFPRPVNWDWGDVSACVPMGGRGATLSAASANFNLRADLYFPCGDMLGWLACMPERARGRGLCMFKWLNSRMPRTYAEERMATA